MVVSIFFLVAIILVLFAVGGIIVALLAWGGRRNGGNRMGVSSWSVNTQNIDQSAEEKVLGIQRIEISTANTEVTMAESDQSNLGVHFYGEASARDEKHLPKLDVQASGSILSVRIDYPNQSYNRTKLDLRIPKVYQNTVTVSTASGGIAIRNLSLTEIHANAASGGIHAEGLKAKSVNFRTASGSIGVRDIEAGAVTLGAASGSIQAENVTGSVDVHSASGSVSVKVDSLKGLIKARSASGSIDLLLPHNAQFKVRAHATSGNISNGFGFNVTSSPGSKWMEGLIGTGEFPVELESASGSIHLRKKIG